jgi:hypothetical protein
MEEWMSLRAYARYRGVALSAVQKAIETRRVTAIREEGGRITGIERHQADEQWGKNTDPVEAARNGKLGAPASVPTPGLASADVKTDPAAAAAVGSAAGAGAPNGEAAPGGGEMAPSGDQGDYLAARAKREGYLAKRAELDYLEQIERLVPSEEVEREVAEIFSQLKSNVFLISDRKAQILAAEGDPVRVHRLLSDEFRTVFDEFSGRLASEAAAGAAEREAAGP